jgi:hypothetical protein
MQKGGSCLLGLQRNDAKLLHFDFADATSDHLRPEKKIARSLERRAEHAAYRQG